MMVSVVFLSFNDGVSGVFELSLSCQWCFLAFIILSVVFLSFYDGVSGVFSFHDGVSGVFELS